MKKRLKGLLALCMAGIMTFAMTTGIASAAETVSNDTQQKDYIIEYQNIGESGYKNTFYPGDIIAPRALTSDTGDTGVNGFNIVCYVDLDTLEDEEFYWTILTNAVVHENGFMIEQAFEENIKGVYRYWDLKSSDDRSIWEKCTAFLQKDASGESESNEWLRYTGEFKWPDGLDDDLWKYKKYPCYEYSTDNSDYDGTSELPDSKDNPKCYAFHTIKGTTQDAENKDWKLCYALELPSVDTLFGEEFKSGYHYKLEKIEGTSWPTEDNQSNVPTGIVPVNNNENALIDTTFLCYGDYGTSDCTMLTDTLLITVEANDCTVKFDKDIGSGSTNKIDNEEEAAASPVDESTTQDGTSATGDNMNITLLMALMLLSGCGIAGAGLYRRNRAK